MLSTLTRHIQRRAWWVVVAAVILTMTAAWYGMGVFSHLSSDEGFEGQGTEAMDVADALHADFPQTQAGAVVLFSSRDGKSLDTPTAGQEVARLLEPLKPDASLLATYYTTGRAAFLSNDKTQTYAAVTVKGSRDEQYRRLTDFMNDARSDSLSLAVGGSLMAERQVSHQVRHDLEIMELVTLPLLAILLVLVFRGVVAAAMPLMLGVVSIVGGLAVVRLITLVTSIDQYAINVITVLGLGLSVDYSLLMVSRYREELRRQSDVPEAIRHTLMTSGRTIFFSGLTVIISLFSLSIFPIEFLRSISLGGMAALVVAMVAALTLLPAALLLLGHRINAWRFGPAPGSGEGPTVWGKVNAVASRLPLVTIGLAVAVILVMAIPFRNVHYTAFDYRSLPVGTSARTVGEALETKFGSGDSNVTVLYRPDEDGANASAAVANLVARLKSVAGVTSVEQPIPSKDGESFKMIAHYSEDDSGVVGRDVVTVIRDLDDTGGRVRVGGPAALVADTLAVIGRYLPWAGLIIVLAMGLLLTLMLRSLLIPLQAIVLSGFSLLASFGAMVFVFQDGHLTHGTWLAHTGGLSPTILLLIFTMAFGLSMDYATFLYSRIREEYDRGKETGAAIHAGVERTGYIITAAAVLMFVVVAAFGSSRIPSLQQVGVGLALAVLVDAFIVRILLVPSVMQILGRANWWAPRLLSRWQIRHE